MTTTFCAPLAFKTESIVNVEPDKVGVIPAVYEPSVYVTFPSTSVAFKSTVIEPKSSSFVPKFAFVCQTVGSFTGVTVTFTLPCAVLPVSSVTV